LLFIGQEELFYQSLPRFGEIIYIMPDIIDYQIAGKIIVWIKNGLGNSSSIGRFDSFS